MAKFWLENDELKSDKSLECFNDWQMYEIYRGLKFGLKNKQISVYANPEFDIYIK